MTISSSAQYITDQLDKINETTKSNNPDQILACYAVIQSIQTLVGSVHDIPPDIIERIGNTVTVLESLIPEGKEEIEGDFLTIGEKELLLVDTGVIVFGPDDDSFILSLPDDLQTIIAYFFQYGNGLPINDEQQSGLRQASLGLNSFFEAAGIFFGIEDGKFYIGDTPFTGNTPRESVAKSTRNISHTPVSIYKTSLGFGHAGQSSVTLEIYSPIKNGNSHSVRCDIGGVQKDTTLATLRYFLDVLVSDDGVVIPLNQSSLLINLLAGTKLETLGTPSGGFKIIRREDTIDITKVKSFHGSSEPIPSVEEVEARTLKNLKDVEVFTIEEHEILFGPTTKAGRGKNGSITVKTGTKVRDHTIKGTTYDLLAKFIFFNGFPIELSISETQVGLPELRNIFGKNFIRVHYGARTYYIGSMQEEPGEMIEIRGFNFDIPAKILAPEESFKGSIGEYQVHTVEKNGSGVRARYEIDINGKVFSLTTAQNTVFIKLTRCEGTTVLDRTEKIHLKNLTDLLDNGGLTELSQLLKSRVRVAEKKKTPSTKRAPNKNTVTPLHQDEQISFYLGDSSYQVTNKTGNGHLSAYLLEIKTRTDITKQTLTTKEYELFLELSRNIGVIVDKEKVAPYILKTLREKLPEGFIQPKRGQGYFIGQLQGFDTIADEVPPRYDPEVEAMIAAAQITESPPIKTISTKRTSISPKPGEQHGRLLPRGPVRKEKKPKTEEKRSPITLEGLREEFDIRVKKS